jgi:hypothetical protein
LTALNRKSTLDHVSCARMPASALALLAGLRRVEGISVVRDGEHAWVFWEPGDQRVLRAVLPALGVELYEKKGVTWHRAGHRLPAFELPPTSEPIALNRVVTPEPFSAEQPPCEVLCPMTLSLARDGRPRPTTAALCSMATLGRWADSATSAEIEAIRGVLQGDSALLLGQQLPAWRGSVRYWGGRVLVPIGFETRPSLPEDVLLEALGGSGRELLRLVLVQDDSEGAGLAVEAIPLEAFRPLSRAGVRLALGALTS